MRKYVKFTGKFRDLVPAGWTFNKLFASNYRVYSKTSSSEQYGDTFWIWQHHGGYVEFEDLYDKTALLFAAVMDGSYLNFKYEVKPCFLFKEGHVYYRFAIHRNSYEMEVYENDKHDAVFASISEESRLGRKITKEEIRAISDSIYNKYKKIIIGQREIDFIKDMISRGWVSIEEDKRT